jgi:hypothetical protein
LVVVEGDAEQQQCVGVVVVVVGGGERANPSMKKVAS